MKTTLAIPNPDGTGAWDWMEFEFEVLPDPNEFLMIEKRGFQIVRRSFELSKDPTGNWVQGCGLLLHQVMGPPMIKPATLSEMPKLRLQ